MAQWGVAFAIVALLAGALWRPHGLGPTLGAAGAVAIVAAVGLLELADASFAWHNQWRAFVTLFSMLVITETAEKLGVMQRVAAWIEPRTRGPVRHAFFWTYWCAAAVAALLSNDAAILLLTPVVMTLVKTVYPRRYPKFVVPFAFAVFVAAGVAPLMTSNPMNLVFAEHTGLAFHRYAAVMIPVALVSWLVSYVVLRWLFVDVLADEAPALGHWPPQPPLSPTARAVLVVLGVVLLSYPLLAYAHVPLWPGSLAGAVVATGLGWLHAQRAAAVTGERPRLALPAGSNVFPFLFGVFLLALAVERVGLGAWLIELYGLADGTCAASLGQTGLVATVSAIGSAAINNHPMSVLNALALHGGSGACGPETGQLGLFAALVGGDLGPRLLPMGSLAALLWLDALQRAEVKISLRMFVRVGLWLTVPSLAASVLVLWWWA